MIVKHPLLRSTLLEDIEFKKTNEQIITEKEIEEKRLDDEKVKVCPKCLQTYIPSKTSHGNCNYHDAFVYDLDKDTKMNSEQAQNVQQKAVLLNQKAEEQPKLIWACCLALYGKDRGCKVDKCGLPEGLTDMNWSEEDPVQFMQKKFMNNEDAGRKVKEFAATLKTAAAPPLPPSAATLIRPSGTSATTAPSGPLPPSRPPKR
ncbi:unnamed protein product [Rotaria socialis]|uniref:Uncharacterized protein n=1 Tax=Rotaria socialis TaxID=392032 RepID=A0A821GXR7_9BILA|nr:unnamed protein product [Rotaria socialis]CAF4675685.1 unnamed protein product [Rotaria socialis]